MVCPTCQQEIIPPRGDKQSRWLLVFSEPQTERSFRDKRQTGLDVIKKELAKSGLGLSEFRLCWLWQHADNGNDDCYNAGRSVVLNEAKGKDVVVLIGTTPSQEFCGKSSDDVAGLQVDSVSLSAPIVFVLPKPEGVFVRGAGIGELRLACQKLERILHRE